MSEDKFNIKITSDTRKTDGYVEGRGDKNITFSAKVYDTPSVDGINGGRISKLDIRKNNEVIFNFDRGWDVKPLYDQIELCEAIMKRLNKLGMAYSLENGSQKTLSEKLESAKEKAAIREYDVKITETLQITVTVEAKNIKEAEDIASRNWKEGDYIIDDAHFKGVTFKAAPTKHERSRGGDILE